MRRGQRIDWSERLLQLTILLFMVGVGLGFVWSIAFEICLAAAVVSLVTSLGLLINAKE